MDVGAQENESRVDRARVALRVLRESGLLHPGFLFASIGGLRRYGRTTGGSLLAATRRRPNAVGLIDDRGSLTFAELWDRSLRLAHGLRAAGIREGSGVGILCRNHRGFLESITAIGLLGADALYLNTGFAAPQLRDVLQREGASAVIYDEEFEEVVQPAIADRPGFIAWHDDTPRRPTLEQLIGAHAASPLPKPGRIGRTTILTSGTTGTPKGAQRTGQSSGGIDTVIGVLELMPLRRDSVRFVVAPAFHAWGLAQLIAAVLFHCTTVLRRRFDPEDTLRTIAATRADEMVVIPTMLQRILELPIDVIRRYDTSCLRLVAASGSALPGDLARRWMDTFGDNLYNLYGSTEVAQASIARPQDLRAAPGTAGVPPRGTLVRILDADGKPLPHGQSGRIFVRNSLKFSGYTGGGGKAVVDDMISTGDVGRFDSEGRLFIEGRDDDMIVSGGENVFPQEVEDLLSDHPAIKDVAVIGVEDAEFGQRLKAFVVLRPGAELDAETVRNHVRSQLARHKVPRDVEFLDEIPRTQTGKVLKRVLRQRS
jgi:acyl-CoA synthetase (AMP-forming)/AMP-acid ligase II